MYFTLHPTLAPLIKKSMFQPNMVCNIFTIFCFIMMWIIYVVRNWLLEMIGESCTAQPQIAISRLCGSSGFIGYLMFIRLYALGMQFGKHMIDIKWVTE